MQLQVHPHTLRVLTRHYGHGPLTVTEQSLLLPLLTTKPILQKVALTRTIELSCPAEVEPLIRPDAGHTLYRHHNEQLYQYITTRVLLGQHALAALNEYYHTYGIDIGELDPASMYRQWYRRGLKPKNPANHLTVAAPDVLPRSSEPRGDLKSAISTAADLLQAMPEVFFTRQGHPDEGMLRKIVIYSLYERHRWTMPEIARLLGMTKQGVHSHLRSFSMPRMAPVS